MNNQAFDAVIPFTIAAESLAAIPYYPKDEGARMAIAEGLMGFVRNEQELDWLVRTATGSMREWKGLAELRGLYCTRYRPLDGIEATCSLPGYSAEDCEAAQARLPQRYLPAPDDSPVTIEERAAVKRWADLRAL